MSIINLPNDVIMKSIKIKIIIYLIKIDVRMYICLLLIYRRSSVDFRKMVRKLEHESCALSSGVGGVSGRSL